MPVVMRSFAGKRCPPPFKLSVLSELLGYAKRWCAARQAGDRTRGGKTGIIKNSRCRDKVYLSRRPRDEEWRMDRSARELPVEHADETVVVIGAAIKRSNGGGSDGPGKNGRNISIRPCRRRSVPVHCAEG